MLNKNTKQAVDLGVPSVLAAVLAVFLWNRYKRIDVMAVGALLAFGISWLIVSRVTKVAYLNGPAPVPTGGGCDGYDPTSLGDSIYEDLHCTFCFRKEELYDQLLALADCQLIKLYNYYSEKYSKSLAREIAEPGTWTSLSGTFTNTQQPLMASRFAKLSLQ